MRPGPGWRLVTLAILTLFFVEAVLQFIPAVYATTLLAFGLTPSIVAVLLFLAPLAYVPLRSLSPRHLTMPFALAVVVFRLLLALPLELNLKLAFSGLTVAAYLLYLPAHLLRDRDDISPGVDAAAFALGFVADATVRSTYLGSDPSATPWAIVPMLALAGVAVYASREGEPGARRDRELGPDQLGRRDVLRVGFLGLAFGAVWGLQFTLLAYPSVLARFVSAPLPVMTLAVLVGLSLGIVLALRGFSSSPRWFLLGNSLAVLALADLAWIASPLLPVLVAIAELVVVVDLAVLFGYLRRGPPTLRAVGLAFGVAGLVFVLYAFVFVFTFVYWVVPGRWLWEGRLPLYLLITALAMAAPAITVAHLARRHGLRVDRVPEGTRRVVTLAVSVLLISAGVGALLAPSVQTPTVPTKVTVMTYNIHQGFGGDGLLDLDRITEIIRDANADVVALQESWTGGITSGNQDAVRRLAARLGYFEAYGTPTQKQTLGPAILSRFPILAWRTSLLPGLQFPAVLVEAEVQVGARTLTVIAVHLSVFESDRALQVASLSQRVASIPEPKVLLGDFNSCPDGVCPSFLGMDSVYSELTKTWNDSWTAVGNDPMDPLGSTWPAGAPDHRIDYVFFSPGLTAEAVSVPRDPLATVASDHLPVIVRLVFA